MINTIHKNKWSATHSGFLGYLAAGVLLLVLVFAGYSLACCVANANLWVGTTAIEASSMQHTSITIVEGEVAYFYARCYVPADPQGRAIKWTFDYGDGSSQIKYTYNITTSRYLYMSAQHEYNTGPTNTASITVERVGVSGCGAIDDEVTVNVNPDTTGPTPNPMTWSSLPAAGGTSSVSMTATTASDLNGVEYYFDETSGNTGGSDSSWQTGASYTDTGLDDLTQYSYRVQARDLSANNNVTDWSSTKSATTLDGTAPSPDPVTWASVPAATGPTSISMTATTAVDPSGVEYYFTCTAGDGHDSGWQIDSSYTDYGLSELTGYTYTVKARDMSPNWNETSASTPESATTPEDVTSPVPDPMTWLVVPYATGPASISMTANTASDVSGVEYYFENITITDNSHDSGWQDSTTYQDTGLDDLTQYAYTVKARDKSSSPGETGVSTAESATTEDGTAPAPVNMTWESTPAASRSDIISMTATTASDPSGVQYSFDETSGNPGANDSGWQDSAVYTDSGLAEVTQYTYTVKARDKSINFNETTASTPQSVTTPLDVNPPLPDPATWQSVPMAVSDSAISMTASTGSDASGVEYYFAETSGNPGADDSIWQTSSSYTDSGLNEGTRYTYRVKMRDQSTGNNEGAWSAESSAATLDYTNPTPDPASWASLPDVTSSTSVSMTAAAASDPSGVEYYFECTLGSGHDSGWQSSTTYQDTFLGAGSTYTYRLKVRDKSPNHNETGWSTPEAVTITGRVSNTTTGALYYNIYEAIDEAGDGDVIEVTEDTYYENLVLANKNIALTGTDPTDPAVVSATIINGSGTGNAVEFSSGDSSIFKGFTVTNSGSGIYCSSSSPVISNCVIEGNDKGISCSLSSPLINNSIVRSNTSVGIEAGTASASIENCLVNSNGSGISVGAGGTAVVRNVTVAGNTAEGFDCDSTAAPAVSNSIVWSNGSTDNWGIAAVTYTCLPVDTGGQGNTTVNPNLDGSYHLSLPSPCVNTGDPAYAAGESETDLDGARRVRAGILDMGAYEYGEVVYVDVQATGSDNGTSWTNAYNHLQDALDSANNEDGDEIWVAAGTYYPDLSTITAPAGSGLRTDTFQLVADVVLYGGFTSGDGSLGDRDPANNQTILSGDIGTGGDNTDNSYHVVTGADDAVLDGFVISKGRANHEASKNSSGGGILCDNTSPIIRNCTFSDNYAHYGGGIHSYESSPYVVNCVFTNNIANESGGSIYNELSNSVFENCEFAGNSDLGNAAVTTPTVTLSQVDPSWTCDPGYSYEDFGSDTNTDYGNRTEWKIFWGDPSRTIVCNYQSALGFTGVAPPDSVFDVEEPFEIGMLRHFNYPIKTDSVLDEVKLTIDLTFSVPSGASASFDFILDIGETQNEDPDPNCGSKCCDDIISFPSSFPLQLIDVDGREYTLKIMGFGPDAGNLQNEFKTQEGQISSAKLWAKITPPVAQAALKNVKSNVDLDNCLFVGNTTNGVGGALSNWACPSIVLNNCTFASNSGNFCGGIYSFESSLDITNTIIWGNIDNDAGTSLEQEQIYNLNADVATTPDCTVTYSCIEDNDSGDNNYSGANNIYSDPLFVTDPYDGGDGWGTGGNDDYGDLRLQAGSGCIDAGDNTAVPVGVTRDIGGSFRFFDDPATTDSGNGSAPIVDMGAYEYQVQVAPVGNGDNYYAFSSNTLTVDAAEGVLVNDTDDNLDNLTAQLVNDAGCGALTLLADGSFTYIPNNSCAGPVTFTYKAADGNGGESAPATVTITVISVTASSDLDTIKLPYDTVNLAGTIEGGTVDSVGWSVEAQMPPLGSVVTFGNATASTTTATFTEPARYVICLQAVKGNMSGSDCVLITVQSDPAAQEAPVPNAGEYASITWPMTTTVSLAGTYTDDGRPWGNVRPKWSMLNSTTGGTVGFGDPNSWNTVATFSKPGKYVLQLEADDGAETGEDTCWIEVLEAFAPVVYAGADFTPTVAAGQTSVSWTVVKDSGGADEVYVRDHEGNDYSSQCTISWEVLMGLKTAVSFEHSTLPGTTATFTAPDIYILRLTATANDTGLSDYDDVVIDISQTEAFEVDAGPNREVVVGEFVFLTGEDIYNTAESYQWSKIDGPGLAIFENNTSLDTANVRFYALGKYIIELEAQHGLKTATDTLVVTVRQGSKVAGGNHHTLFLNEEGVLYASGRNTESYYGTAGVLGVGSNETREPSPIAVVGLGGVDIISMDAGLDFSLAVDTDGHVWSWGSNHQGKLGINKVYGTGADEIRVQPTPTKVVGGEMGTEFLEDIIKVAAGDDIALALDKNGNVWAWGFNGDLYSDGSSLGIGLKPETIPWSLAPVKVQNPEDGTGFLSNIVDIDVYWYELCVAADKQGRVWTWGNNPISHMDSLWPECIWEPKETNDAIVDVACNYGGAFGLTKAGEVWSLGAHNYYGEGGDGHIDCRSYDDITKVVSGNQDGNLESCTPLKNIIAISSGRQHALALEQNRRVWHSGRWGVDLANREYLNYKHLGG
ncbi:MAG: choice-of-anchor K domain-containing protein, partial [Planctomycetota bacterium]